MGIMKEQSMNTLFLVLTGDNFGTDPGFSDLLAWKRRVSHIDAYVSYTEVRVH